MEDVRTGGAEAAASTDVVLAEPVRQRLVTIASDVLGRLPAEDVPAGLRRFARFAPARRARIAATALAAVLDSDQSFRDAVGEAVATSSPELAATVREGGSTAASDPVDVAVVAYLSRPSGWRDVVSLSMQRWSAERVQTGQEATGGELARLRMQVAELKLRARSDGAALKTAIDAAAVRDAGELAELRRQLRVQTGELRTGQRLLEQAERARLAAETAAAAVDAVREGELRRARTRIVELEQALENARRTTRAERDVADARLWLLVDTLTEAAAGIRRELSLPPPAVRPADFVDSAAATTGQRRLTEGPALEQALSMPNTHLIVDGYNVTKTGYDELSLADQRSRLIGALAALGGRFTAEITVAFDGGNRPPVLPATPRGVRVLFSGADEIADDLIRRLVSAEPAGRPVVVVSSDQQVATDVRRAGAWSAPSAALLALT